MTTNKFSLDPVTQNDAVLPPISNVTTHKQEPKSAIDPQQPASTHPFIVSWRDAFNTGILQVDKDHKHLFNLVAILSAQNVDKVLDELLTYVAEHFQHEEELMSLSAYPDMAQHVAQHRAFTDAVGNAATAVATVDSGRWLASDEVGCSGKAGRVWARAGMTGASGRCPTASPSSRIPLSMGGMGWVRAPRRSRCASA